MNLFMGLMLVIKRRLMEPDASTFDTTNQGTENCNSEREQGSFAPEDKYS